MSKGKGQKPKNQAPAPAPLKIKRDRSAAHERRMAKQRAKAGVERGTARRLRRAHEAAESASRRRVAELKKEGNLVA